MWTETNRKYYTLLRAQEKERSAKGGTLALSGTATHAGSSKAASGRTARATAPIADATFVDPSEGQTRVLDPVAVLQVTPAEIQKVTDLTLAHRGLTDIHPNLLLFGNLASLALHGNRLRLVRNLLPQPPAPASSSLSRRPAAHSPAGTAGSPSVAATVTAAGASITHSHETAPAVHSTAAVGHGRLLDHLTAPRGCTRLLRLYLADNLLVNLLDTDIPRLTTLHELYLANNNINDLPGTVQALRRLRALRCLDLSGNPVTEEPGYRHRLLCTLPQLEVLDRLTVQPTEREAATLANTTASATAAPASTRGAPRGRRAQRPSTTIATAQTRPSDASLGTPSPNAAAGARSVHFAAPPAGGVSRRSGSPAAGPATVVAFGSSYTAPASAHASTSKSRSTWPVSATVKQLDVRRARYLDEQTHRQRDADAAVAAELTAVEEERLAFHAVWGLSGQDMPLSAQRYNQWSTAMGLARTNPSDATKLGSPTAQAANNNNNNNNNGTNKASTQPSRRRSSGRRRSSQGGVAGSGAAVSASTGAEAGGAAELLGPDTVKRLLPALPLRHAVSPPVAGAGANGGMGLSPPPASVLHESRLYDALLERPEAVETKSSQLCVRWTHETLPPAGRLQTMRTAVEASKALLQHHVGLSTDGRTVASPAVTAPSSQFASPDSSRPSSSASARPDSPPGRAEANPNAELMALVAAEENAEAARLLTAIQQAKAAMVPRPWESAPAQTTLALMGSDLQRQALKLLHVFLLPQELRMLEAQFNGLCEVLLVLKSTNSGGTDGAGMPSTTTTTAQSMAEAASPTTPTAAGKSARSVSESSAGAGGGGGGGGGKRKGAGRTTTVSLTTASTALLEGGTLPRLLLNPLLISTGPSANGRRRSANGLHTGSQNASVASRGRLNSSLSAASASVAASPASIPLAAAGGAGQSFTSLTSATAGGTLPPGTVGPYVEESVETLLSTLVRETGAWELDVEAVLGAMAALHHVDLATGELQRTDEEEAGPRAPDGGAGTGVSGGSPAVTPASAGRALPAPEAALPALDDAALSRAPKSTAKKSSGKNSSVHSTAGSQKKTARAQSSALTAAGATEAAAGDCVRTSFSAAAGGALTADTASGGPGISPRVRLAYMTLNSALLALVYYLPFVDARVDFFRAQSRDGVAAGMTGQPLRMAGAGGVTGGATEWFRRAQQAELHQRALRAALAALFREGPEDASAEPRTFDAFAERVMASPQQLGTRQVAHVGGFFAGAAASA